MNHWPFIIAAYGLTLGGTALLLLVAFVRMRRFEKRAEELKRR
ncbi:heme exporter protein CcmD [Sphingomicrobium lutaoense]|uniref:Heme exporter protein D n=1 Tax=Sphingomicrobium lutaoense TaxID=515949 RepID=A0A839YX14_9SPHN|nr:heme exporter protein CcmD [Sphingomicrobium lutaoense]MBB3763576.1 putative integral membrane protein [Sphingomicrobium lutaoense]